MHTEHLQNIRPGLVGMGWVVAAAITSLIMFVLLAFNLIDPESAIGTRAAIVAVAAGFYTGGMYAGLRAKTAPILYGVCIGLLSLLVWFGLNVISAVAFPNFGWSALTPNLTVGLILIMIISAVLGARAAYRKTR